MTRPFVRQNHAFCLVLIIWCQATFYNIAQGESDISKESAELRQWILANPDKINALDKEGSTLLHRAIVEGNVNNVDLLITAGADVTIETSTHIPPTHLATMFGFPGITEMLLAAGAPEDDFVAAGLGNLKKLKVLREDPKRLNAKSLEGERSLLHFAAACGQADVVRFLLDAGTSPAISPQFGGYFGSARVPGGTALHVASWNGREEIVRILAEHKYDLDQHNDYGETPLLIACQKNSADVVKYLLSRQVNVQFADQDGNTPLHFAVKNKTFDIAEALIKAGANVNTANKDGETPLHWASIQVDAAMVKLLLQHGASAESVSRSGFSSLHWLAWSNSRQQRLPIARMLIAKGSPIDKPDGNGNSTLHWACVSGDLDLVILLLEKGADPNRKNSRGLTPKDTAKKKRFEQLVRTLGKDVQHPSREQ